MVSRRLNTETHTYSYRQFCSPRFQSLTVAKKEKEALAFYVKKKWKTFLKKGTPGVPRSGGEWALLRKSFQLFRRIGKTRRRVFVRSAAMPMEAGSEIRCWAFAKVKRRLCILKKVYEKIWCVYFIFLAPTQAGIWSNAFRKSPRAGKIQGPKMSAPWELQISGASLAYVKLPLTAFPNRTAELFQPWPYIGMGRRRQRIQALTMSKPILHACREALYSYQGLLFLSESKTEADSSLNFYRLWSVPVHGM